MDGYIYHISGKIGSGKTYRSTMLAILYLKQGYVVYTNWELDLRHFSFDERESVLKALRSLVTGNKYFYNFDISKNWNYYDLAWGQDMVDKYRFKTVQDFVASRTDCVFIADEGQDLFDSYEGVRLSKEHRMAITRTRHMSKILIIVSQRPQAVAVSARANIMYFDKVVRTWFFWDVFGKRFKVYRTEDMDSQNMPVWGEENLNCVDSYLSSSSIYNAYNSWYLRKGVKTSQVMSFDVYEIPTFKDRLEHLYRFFVPFIKKIKGLKVFSRSATANKRPKAEREKKPLKDLIAN